MKKLALAVIATAFLAVGHGTVNAQELPAECESGEFQGTEQECIDFYVEVLPPTTPAPTSTTTTTIVQVAGPLPQTGSGVSPILGMGALLLVGGGIIVVATRRRSAAPAS